MGCLSSQEQTPQRSAAASETKERLQFEGKSPILEFPFNIPTPPLVNGNEAIFFSTNSKTKTTSYIKLDLDRREVTTADPVEIKCNEEFDVFNTVYALNVTQNKIYFVENNRDISTLELAENEIIPLNKSIETTNGNHANIAYSSVTDKVYIFGAESKSDLDDNYIHIPYSTATKYKNSEVSIARIMKFGDKARVFSTNENGSEWIYICGGQKDIGNKKDSNINCPNDAMWHYIISNDDDYDENARDLAKQKWQGHYLPSATHSYGIVNYDDRFMFCFGGEVQRPKKPTKTTSCVYILPLKDGEYNLQKGMWYELARRLPKADHFHAIYNKGSQVIHLFSYDGNYFTLKVQDILNELEVDGVREKDTWSAQGKTVLPTKSTSIKNMGPKGAEMDDSD